MSHPSKIRVMEPFLLMVMIGAAMVYLVNAFNSGTWLWFQSTATNVRPSRIVIVDNGQRTVLSAGHANFDLLADAASTSLSKLNNTDLVSIGLSDQTLEDYATKSLIVELYFDQPVQFNTLARSGKPTQLLIPIEGRHAGGGYVFRGQNGSWWFGAIRMADPAPLYSALQQMGYTAAVLQPAS
ncbi:MAG: hypothetical protein R3E31_12165 [Chloroflexota bacterium]|nr:hypothetical protein [Anaerolineales bacterium]MCB8967467.1 hypothetical protein [Ardenticatenaceae bacterium]